MHRKPFALLSPLVVLLLSTVGTPGVGTASCTAGNPNPSVIETTPTADFVDHGDGTVTHHEDRTHVEAMRGGTERGELRYRHRN